jgi:hypothetical protein
MKTTKKDFDKKMARSPGGKVLKFEIASLTVL